MALQSTERVYGHMLQRRIWPPHMTARSYAYGNNREEESVENAFGPSINCSESNVTFAKAHVYSCEIAI